MTPASEKSPPRDRWYALSVLTVVYSLNIADRYSVSTLLEPIRQELHLTDSGIAFLTGVSLALFYVTAGIPLAVVADRAHRRNVLALALAVWSGMTALCGIARNYGQFLLARFAVGIGEAGGTPPSTSMLADYFPPARRPMALTIFALGACVGAWLGSSLVGSVAERSGWRAVFFLLGIPGLLLALIVWLTLREPARGQLDDLSEPLVPSTLGLTLRHLYANRAVVHLLMGGSVATLWSWGLMWWTPAFLQRSHHLTVGEVGQLLGPMHLIAGAAGTLLASWLMSRRAAAQPRYVTTLLALGTASMTVPSFFIYWVDSERTATALLWVYIPAVYFYIGPTLGLLQNLVPPNMRATACALLMFISNLANLVIAPQVVGWLSDWFASSFGAGTESLRWALLILAPTGVWAAAHFWVSGKSLRVCSDVQNRSIRKERPAL